MENPMRDYTTGAPIPASVNRTPPPPGQIGQIDQTELELVAARLSELLGYVQHQRDRTLSMGDRLLGPIPEVQGKDPASAPRAGILGQIQDTLDFIFNNVRSTDDALTRLRNAI
jgi:hypothetical protein